MTVSYEVTEGPCPLEDLNVEECQEEHGMH